MIKLVKSWHQDKSRVLQGVCDAKGGMRWGAGEVAVIQQYRDGLVRRILSLGGSGFDDSKDARRREAKSRNSVVEWKRLTHGKRAHTTYMVYAD